MISEKGNPFPLGATVRDGGVNFALFSAHAKGVDLCLFDSAESHKESARIRLKDITHNIWHTFVPGLKPGQCYGFRVYGPYNPQGGHRFNPGKVVLDPYARAIAGKFHWDKTVFGYRVGAERADLARDYSNNARSAPLSVVVDDDFDWEDDEWPRIPYNDTIIYEMHVKGFTKRHPQVPEEHRGTYLGLTHDSVIGYLKDLGVTAVELLPVHQHVDEMFLHERGLTNYWGYSPIGYFAPESDYSATGVCGQQVHEFKTMVKALHKAGLEVILDVVYNHTGEGNHLGPTLCFRGIDNACYYRLNPNRRYYNDFTGTGNTLDITHPRNLQLVLDSLRYWVQEMHVDGFRFDLATCLGRNSPDFSQNHTFFQAILQDPVLTQIKMIAEPWDLGPGGYQVGGFPAPWAEWNGRYRDDIRCYWKGDHGLVPRLASRITGSQDIYGPGRRLPTSSINFVTSHDGFTLRDLVSYNKKHNEANKEGNRDGDDHNNSWNCGVEGPTDDKKILALRARLQRSFLATIFVSQGVPMLLAGDEFGRSQSGNNNAYCQDNEISWLDWEHDSGAKALLEFTKKIIRLRREHPVFRRSRFFNPEPRDSFRTREIIWFNDKGLEMTADDWNSPHNLCLGLGLHGHTEETPHTLSPPPGDVTFLLLFNSYEKAVKFRLPGVDGVQWKPLIDSSNDKGEPTSKTAIPCGDTIKVADHSLIILNLDEGSEKEALSPCEPQ